jgi:Rhodopirellula transposase DDE domain
MGHEVSSSTIPKLLEELNIVAIPTANRDAQFEYIKAKVAAFQAAGEPVISIDAKKKELLGEFKNGGSDYSLQGQPIEVNTDDFEDMELGKSSLMGSTTSAPRLCRPRNRPRHRGVRHQRRPMLARSKGLQALLLYPGMRRLMIKEMATLNMTRDSFHPEWNYSISPRLAEMKQ